jgi:hypothetical protein
MDAEPDSHMHAFVMCQTDVECLYGFKDTQGRPYRPLGVVLMRLGIAEIDQ